MLTRHQLYEDTPIINLVDSLLHKAIVQAASDIHLESIENGLRVRYRIDGMLYDQEPMNHAVAQQVLSRLKVLAHLDITEKRIPQDGKFQVTPARYPIDLRISTFPSLHGEKMVVRILDRVRTAINLDQLGFSSTMLPTFKQLLAKPSGFFLVAGPTGSGKTTTLYAALTQLNAPHKNIITLEDPVEYNVAGITQGQINPEVGFSFEKGMRAILRQDPDIVMIGEIRDKQTAQIAIEASLTGHLVLSTIHTHDAASVIMRLMDMGIEPFLINAALSGVLAQRLARTICTTCRVAAAPTEQEQLILEHLGVAMETVYKGLGCAVCMQLGYKGRTGIFELLPVTQQLRSLIVQHPAFDGIVDHIRAQGVQSLLEDGIEKVRSGIITVHELVRVVA